MSAPRILVAGIGNIFLGDDAFGVEAVQLLATQTMPEGVRVVDFGIRGFDLAYALMDEYEAAILVDTMAHNEAPARSPSSRLTLRRCRRRTPARSRCTASIRSPSCA